MKFKSVNPYTGAEIASYSEHSIKQLSTILNKSQDAFRDWRKETVSDRCKLMAKAGEVLLKNTDRYAKLISSEMGKPITEARAEVEKCAWVCAFYAENGEKFLADEIIKTDASRSYVRHQPIGTVFAVMPWNYPFWQVFRFAAPTLTAGNSAILKHASNVLGCAEAIAEVFEKAGFPKHLFQNVFIGHEKAEHIISHPAVQAVSLTGSEGAGSAIARLAGKYLKKTLLELGGSNAFVVFADADLDEAVSIGVNARMMNTGQSCIASKRFIVEDAVYDAFIDKYTKAVIELKSGDPLENDTQIGTLARQDLGEIVQKQVAKSIRKGAKLILGGKQRGAYFEPTILADVKKGMPAFDEETFGPVAAIIRAKDANEAIGLSQSTDYALGISIFTSDPDAALAYTDRIADGAVFINSLVKSDPRLPFGGQKNSGYGRELSRDGMMEFVNRMVVYIA